MVEQLAVNQSVAGSSPVNFVVSLVTRSLIGYLFAHIKSRRSGVANLWLKGQAEFVLLIESVYMYVKNNKIVLSTIVAKHCVQCKINISGYSMRTQ